MSKWYQANVSFYKEDSKGRAVKITEIFLVSSVSYTDAEARVHESWPVTPPTFSSSFQKSIITMYSLSKMAPKPSSK
ncbi:DUF4494 family protein [Emticicia sp. W12TSBA100-4]|uniref:DUF4494 family protein n=1 Tax=Emticicia sp. W12TSBA100-4 TaxID=3160965 RepID=UPI0033066064